MDGLAIIFVLFIYGKNYLTHDAVTDHLCYWNRLRSFTGEMDLKLEMRTRSLRARLRSSLQGELLELENRVLLKPPE